MKKIIKTVSLILTVLIATATCGCSKESGNIIKDTSDIFYENGKTEYVALISDNATDNEIFAADELKELFKKATGTEIKTVRESNLKTGDRYISLGKTDELAKSGIKTGNQELGLSGYKIETKGKNVYIFGDDDNESEGVVYGVYKFLNAIAGYVYYSDRNIYFDVPDKIMLKNFNVTDVPDFNRRYVNTLSANVSRTYRSRMRYTSRENISKTVSRHNSFNMINPEIYYEAHPDWFSRDAKDGKYPSQLCYTNKEMIAEYIKNLKEAIRKEPDRTTYYLQWEDNVKYCECESCLEGLRKYKNYGGINCVFMNIVAEEVQKWIETDLPGRKVNFKTIAYYATDQAPVEKNDDGTYSPVCEEVVTRPDVSVLVWLINNKLRHKSLDDPENAYAYETYKQWTAVCSDIEAGNYAVNYYETGYMYAINDFDAVERDMEIFHELGVKEVLYTFAYQVTDIAPFFDLKAYCLSNLMWNSSLSYEELANDFIEKNYLSAAPIYKEYYNIYKTWMTSLELTYKMQTSNGWMINTTTFPKALVDRFFSLLNGIQTEAERYRDSDPEVYERISASVRKEKIMPLFMYVNLYRDNFGKDEIRKMINDFESYTLEFKILLYGENFFIRDLLANWRAKSGIED